MRILHYINQFFGQKGGEEAANHPIELVDGPVGPGGALNNMLGDKAEIVSTIICGDSYFNENEGVAVMGVKEIIEQVKPDLIVTGPAFNAGRYGVACGRVGKLAAEMGITCIGGMYPENPGYDLYKQTSYLVETRNSAADMRKALPNMAALISSFIEKEGKLGMPAEEGYMPRNLRVNMFAEKRGAARAVDMLIAKLAGEEFTTEYPMPVFDTVAPFAALKSLKDAKIALVTSGGVVPKHNPDHIESSSAQKYGEYSLKGITNLTEETFETAHGGYDPVVCNEDADVVLPVDVLRELESEGKIGSLHEMFYTTVGNGTSVSNSKKFGAEIAQKLLDAGVSAAILTST